MAYTKESLISVAISLLGHKPIQTLDDDNADDLVVSAEQAFDFLLPASLTENSWRFATRITQLSKVASETPPAGYKNVFLLPSGWLKTIRVYPHNYSWDIYENKKIYADFDGEVYLEHVFQPDISRLPPYFVKYFVFEVAAFLCLTNAQKVDYYNAMDSKRGTQLGIAMSMDAQNRPQNSQATFPVLNAPNVGTGYQGYLSNDG